MALSSEGFCFSKTTPLVWFSKDTCQNNVPSKLCATESHVLLLNMPNAAFPPASWFKTGQHVLRHDPTRYAPSQDRTWWEMSWYVAGNAASRPGKLSQAGGYAKSSTSSA